MGRFRYIHEDDDEDGEHEITAMEWEFVPSNDQESRAITVRPPPPHDCNDNSRTCVGDASYPSLRSSQQPFIVLVPADRSSDAFFSRRARTRSWFTALFWYASCILVVLFAAWVQREGPPAPPPSSRSMEGGMSTWNQYLSYHAHQLWESTSALFYHTPSHLFQWWAHSVQVDWADWRNKVEISWRGEGDASAARRACSLSIPDNLARRLLRGTNNTRRIVGQVQAVLAASEAMSSWKARDSLSVEPNAPLIFLLVGPRSTGKRTLARAIARAVSNCTFGEASGASLGPPVHVLSGRHYRPHVDHGASSLAPVKLQLLHDLERHVGGPRWASVDHDFPSSFVVIDDIDELEPSVLIWLLTGLTSSDERPSTASLGSKVSDGLGSLHTLRRLFSRSVLFLTSSTLGTKTIASWLRHYGPQSFGMGDDDIFESGDLSPHTPQRLPHGFFLDAEQEIDEAYGTSLWRMLSAFVPFVPSSRDALVQLFCDEVKLHLSRNIAAPGGSVLVRDSAAQAFLQRRVEFVSWSHRSEGDESSAKSVLTFSSSGASPVPKLSQDFAMRILSSCHLDPGGQQKVLIVDMASTADRASGRSWFTLKWCDEFSSTRCADECVFDMV